jgi:hypothetical protein
MLNFSDSDMDVINTIDDTFLKTSSTKLIGSSITRLTASVSTFCSAMVFILILRSSQKLSTLYHRLMFGMCAYDFIESCAFALTTLPMPRDMIYTQFEGVIKGTNGTCEAQAVIILWGWIGSFSYSVALCSYFLKMSKQMAQQVTFNTSPGYSRRFEPTIHVVCICYPLAVASWLLIRARDALAPSPFLPFCSMSAYPYYCGPRNQHPSCSKLQHHFPKGTHSNLYRFAIVFVIFFSCTTLYVIFSLITSARSFGKVQEQSHGEEPSNDTEETFKYYTDIIVDENNPIQREKEKCPRICVPFRKRRQKKSRLSASGKKRSSSFNRMQQERTFIRFQVFLYIVVFMTGPTFMIMRIMLQENTDFSGKSNLIFIALRPIRGTLHFLLFCMEKIYNFRLTHPEESYFKSFICVLLKPMEEGYIFSHMSVVESTIGQGRGVGDHSQNCQASAQLVTPCFPLTDSEDLSDSFELNATTQDIKTWCASSCDQLNGKESTIQHDVTVKADSISFPIANPKISSILALNGDNPDSSSPSRSNENDYDDGRFTTFLSEELLNDVLDDLDDQDSDTESYEDMGSAIFQRQQMQDEEEGPNVSAPRPLSYYQEIYEREIINFVEGEDSNVLREFGEHHGGEINEFGLTTIYESGDEPGEDNDSDDRSPSR